MSRRDFLNGMLLAGASGPALAQPPAASYPPALGGLRGSHAGSFEAAHALAWTGQSSAGPLAAAAETVDLIVIGAGISGLAAAHYYRETVKRDARVLILDNHDDFGGHARRCELDVDGQTYLSYGGTQSIDSPERWSPQASALLRTLGIDLEQLREAYDLGFFKRHGLTLGTFYDQPSWGRAALLQGGLPTRRSTRYYSHHYLPGLAAAPAFAATLAAAPLTAAQAAALRAVLAGAPAAASAYFAGPRGRARFEKGRYADFLKSVYGIADPALIALLSMPLVEDMALGGHAVRLADAFEGGLLGLPGVAAVRDWWDGPEPEELPAELADDESAYVYHFPDGNASIARLLVARLIPGAASCRSVEECLAARLDYGALDRPGQPVRLRLNSLAVLAQNTAQGTRVRYRRGAGLYEVRARHTVMAGWHMMAAHLMPELPARQREAMRANIKIPMVYAQVALRQWAPLKKSGVAAAYCPGSFFQFVQMDFPVALGHWQPRREPDAPMVLLMIRSPCPMLGEGSPSELFRQGRAELLGQSFDDFELQIRAQLSAMYGPNGFDAKRDIAAITVHRWPHGFVYGEALLGGVPAHHLARRRHGRIAIANADAAGSAYTQAAIDMAWRAVRELASLA
ncbi:FAD/NAD(P)-binding protein [Paucibacter soli]|uniref:FAD/NAD(P)-binding protein n=1 Tax=Paucibacter soli TaxID=3133433 RepID=UPI0030AC56D1